MFHSYVLYPVLLKLFSLGKKQNALVYDEGDTSLPEVFIVFSVYNEERVIREKLESIFNTTYPLQKLKVYIGSDCSSDNTNNIVDEFAAKYPQLHFFKYTERGGKSNVLNKLVSAIEAGKNDIFIFTDANVMFTPATIFELAKHFKNEAICQVGANILNKGVKSSGISFQEKQYIQGENTVKYLEGLNWGTMMGAFGACYAMRASCWTLIPSNYLMEDFYLSMNVLSKNKQAINEPLAICYEDVSNELEEEFKRKSRIQAGNFQNLAVYWRLLFRFDAVSFCFFSHKLLRWLGPVFIILAYLSNLLLLPCGQFYLLSFVVQNLLLVSPVVDAVLKRLGIHLILLRFASYFYMMNLALVNGFIMYTKGIKTNAWNPTKRNV
jgi:cellulose synthase/poly-beta-1,6-N-acetylglucosamine synthase-like glycosyltransferase